MIRGLSVEILEISRFERALERRGERLLRRVFTPSELRYCLARRTPARHLAARFAAKVSFMRASGLALSWRSVEVVRDPWGRPGIRVLGARVPGGGSLRASLSITHTTGAALAAVIVEDRP